ncbi:MAG: acyltransferase [Candidatus Sumerlaeia bacterium]
MPGKSRADAPGVFIHDTARVDSGAEVGEGTRIWHFSHVREGARIGRRCILGQNVYVDPGVRIGDGVKIENNVSVYTGVEIEDYVFVGPSAVFTNVINPRAHIERKTEFRPTRVRRGATIGANATIVCGVEIGEFAFVAAGAVVTRDVAAFALVRGAPARRAGWMCQCGLRLAFSGGRSVCAACGAAYEMQAETGVRLTAPPRTHFPFR